MIEAVRIRNWQSLKHLDLRLGRYTVIVGASSSGKTALMRAFKALASNVRGTGQITRGASTAAITAVLDDGEVTLEYRAGAWRYNTVLLGHEDSYTKLAGAVPEEITNILRIAPVPASGTSINFAGQFDRPYLLSSDDSGAKVARTLGELTNAHIILEAVREAVRRRNLLAGTLKVREQDLAAAVDSVREYVGLPARLTALSDAERLWQEAYQIEARMNAVAGLRDGLRAANEVMARHQVLPEVPSAEEVDDLAARVREARSLYDQLVLAESDKAAALFQREGAIILETHLEQKLHELLREAGTCPTCGQLTTERI